MVDGFLVIDKPAGLTSHDVVNRVRRILNTRKVGHTGTLDPFATGVLPVAVGEATKAITFLDEGRKSYDAVAQLGLVTDTLDVTGAVLKESDTSSVTVGMLQDAIIALTGEISQIPPMYSALKQGGQPLYKLARKGIEVERKPRQVTINSFELVSYVPPLVEFRVVCSRGTYVRTLADDLGSSLGPGACLTALRRTSSGLFTLSKAVTLEELSDAVEKSGLNRYLISPGDSLGHLPLVELDKEDASRVLHGISITVLNCNLHEGLVRLYCEGRFLAVARHENDGVMKLQRVFN